MNINLAPGIVAFLLGFGLVGCANLIQKEMFGCRQSPHNTYCPR